MNKYLISLAAFIVWMLFFDDRDVMTTHVRQPGELRQLKQSKAFYEQEIVETRKELESLKSNAATIEKYAREKYLMKRENEDLFLVREATDD